jgi:hypothetical protein
MNEKGGKEFERLCRELEKIQPSSEKIQKALDRVHQALNETRSAKNPELSSESELDHENDPIVRNLERLSQINPPDDQIRRTIQRTERTLKKRTRAFYRVLVLTGIAATIFFASALLYIIMPHNDAQATLTFGQVLEAQRAYKDWYRVDTEEYNNPSQVNLHRPAQTYWSYTDPTCPRGIGVHKTEKGFWFHWLEKPRSTFYFYDETSNTLRIYWGVKVQKIIGTLTLPIDTDLRSIFAELKVNSVRNISQIQSTLDGSYERFDIPEVYFTDPEIRKKMGPVTLWVDPSTKLIQKWKCQYASGSVHIFRFTYNVLPVRNIYDLGVPPLAKVIDNRPAAEVRDLLARLEAQRGINERFGEYVAVLTNSRLGQDRTLQKNDLLIYSRQKEGWAYAEYSAGEVPNLDGWPVPNISKTFEQTRSIISSHVFVDHGNAGWECWYQPDKKSYRLREVEPEKRNIFRVGFSLSGYLWPGPSTLYSDELDFRVHDVKIVRDDNHPDLIGLVVDQWGFGPQKNQNRIVRTYWLDPARDNLSVEREYRSYLPDGITLVLEAKTKFQCFDQLPNGKWYPALWRKTTNRYENGELVENYEEENNLTISPGGTPDPNWYAELVSRLNLPNSLKK